MEEMEMLLKSIDEVMTKMGEIKNAVAQISGNDKEMDEVTPEDESEMQSMGVEDKQKYKKIKSLREKVLGMQD